LGPAGGEQETITEQSVRNRYLLGMLAPLKIIEIDEAPFEELADGSEDNAEEGTAEPSTPAKRGVAPATFGLSFCLDLAETAFEAEAHWGQYLHEPDADGKFVWKRYRRGGSLTIPLKEGNLRPWSPDVECPHVVVRGRVRLRAGHWSVTLFLSNEQEEGRPRDMYWLFQAELAVRGRFARRPGQGHVSTLFRASRTRPTRCCTGGTWSLPAATAPASSGNWPRAGWTKPSTSILPRCRARWCARWSSARFRT
jgi:hypothetical protein